MATFSMNSEVSLQEWIERELELLKLEKEAESQQLSEKIELMSPKKAQESGMTLLDLMVDETCAALMGRCCLTLARVDGKLLPSCSIKVGDEVLVYDQRIQKKSSSDGLFGIVSKVSKGSIQIISDSTDTDELQSPLRLDLQASEQTYKKLTEALNNLPRLTHPLINIIFNGIPINAVSSKQPLTAFNTDLNESQIAAVQNAIDSSYLSLVHGPPGTGKTSTVVECILQFLKLGQKVLLCCPSNTAVDTVLQRLVNTSACYSLAGCPPLQLVRLGHPARVHPSILRHCLDSLIVDDDGTDIVCEVRADIDKTLKSLAKSRQRSEKDRLRSELRDLRKEARRREAKVVDGIIKSRNVVLCTNVGAASKLLRDIEFDVVLIDEAAQALEASCWIPIVRAKKTVLFGDHKQLPPTIKSEAAARGGLAVTLFERVMNCPGLALCSRLLNIQYRMNKAIATWASDSSYDGRLISDHSVAEHTLLDLVGVSKESLEDVGCGPLLLIDSAGCDMDEDSVSAGQSHSNTLEANVVQQYVRRLLASGLTQENIGIITPYNGQVDVLRLLLHEEFPSLEIRTVDGFQGGEKEAIVISFVRSNAKKEVGFLSDERRINVAVTRAKRLVAIICNSETCSSNPFLKNLIDYVSDNGEHRSAAEYIAPAVSAAAAIEYIPSMPVLLQQVNASKAMNSSEYVSGTSNPKTFKIVRPAKVVDSRSRLTKEAYSSALESELRLLLNNFAKSAASGGLVRISSIESVAESTDAGKGIVSVERGYSPRLLEFPSTLTSFQRMELHSLAGDLRLFHRSVGEGSTRCIQVSTLDFDTTCSESDVGDVKYGVQEHDAVDDDFISAASSFSVLDDDSSLLPGQAEEFVDKSLVKAAPSSSYVQIGGQKKGKYISAEREAFLRSLELKSTNEDDMLAEAIEKNSSYKQTVKYRVSASPMPNPDKLKNQNALRAKLEEARKLRTSQSLGTPTETKRSKPGAKKPVKAQVHTLGTS